MSSPYPAPSSPLQNIPYPSINPPVAYNHAHPYSHSPNNYYRQPAHPQQQQPYYNRYPQEYPGYNGYPGAGGYGYMPMGAGGPGPATMQNGYAAYGEYGMVYGGYGGYPEYAPPPMRQQQQPGNGSPMNGDEGSEHSIPFPETPVPPGSTPQPPQAIPNMGPIPAQQFPPYPANHPYAFGGGVGYQQHPAHIPTFRPHPQHPQQPPHPHQAPYYPYNESYAPLPSGLAQGQGQGGGKLNPAAAGFKYQRFNHMNGNGERQIRPNHHNGPTFGNAGLPNGYGKGPRPPTQATPSASPVVTAPPSEVSSAPAPPSVPPATLPPPPVEEKEKEKSEEIKQVDGARTDPLLPPAASSATPAGPASLNFLTSSLSPPPAEQSKMEEPTLVDARPSVQSEGNTWARVLKDGSGRKVLKRAVRGAKTETKALWSTETQGDRTPELSFGEIDPEKKEEAVKAVPEVKTETKVESAKEPETVEVEEVEEKPVQAPAPIAEPQTKTVEKSEPEVAPTPPTAATPAPASTPVAPPKPRSWAALLQPSTPSASTTPSKTTSPSKAPSPNDGPAPAGPQPAQPAAPKFSYAGAASSSIPSPHEMLIKLLSEGVPSKGGKREGALVPRGLINTGNMCFANTILQVLVYCPPFTELFEEFGKRLQADLARKTPLLEAMIVFLREFLVAPTPADAPKPKGKGKEMNKQKEAFIPENVYDAMKENKRFDTMRRGHQEDAEEYLGFFLDTIHEEILYLLSRAQPPKPTSPAANEEVEQATSPLGEGVDGWLEVGKKQKTHVVRNTGSKDSAVSRLFGGKLRSVLHTPGQKDSVTVEPYQPLQLDIQAPQITSINDALLALSTPEIVPGVWSASRKENVDATKTVYVEEWPRVLICHLKRFVYDAKEGGVVKRGKAVAYGSELVVPQEIISPSKRSPTPTKYALFGVVYHHGSSASGGHYTVAVSKPPAPPAPVPQSAIPGQIPAQKKDERPWIHFDDEQVREVKEEEVVVSKDEVEEGRCGLVGGREKCAYLLFYRRIQ
ncbi:hypothetical protein L198_06825 [Cryptococcus wingfieldii CBS 7118]|uniref:ubiquitinyl hydrolase 1 n=1 Tax=Cryptococcus wingfieldii CBS 7118 TaxID=1295528 RepID=A0A1E3IHJ8_9TREE|nr:hypothetical protein L198_06825 [Cryptococcus wingfieldii CBS 7118]ODN88069.1 hypothetical protein L198_06825 [Cryptococcus wingfieldii CBS 7118]